jgi:hypothetical protein
MRTNFYKIHQSYLPKYWCCDQTLLAKMGRQQFRITSEADSGGFVTLRKLPLDERVSYEQISGGLKSTPFRCQEEAQGA